MPDIVGVRLTQAAYAQDDPVYGLDRLYEPGELLLPELRVHGAAEPFGQREEGFRAAARCCCGARPGTRTGASAWAAPGCGGLTDRVRTATRARPRAASCVA